MYFTSPSAPRVNFHFSPVGESGAATSDQSAGFDLRDHFFRAHIFERQS